MPVKGWRFGLDVDPRIPRPRPSSLGEQHHLLDRHQPAVRQVHWRCAGMWMIQL